MLFDELIYLLKFSKLEAWVRWILADKQTDRGT